MITMSEFYGELSDNQLSAFEAKLGIALAKDYREFLLEFNGGRSKSAHFDIASWGNSLVNNFYGLGIDDEYELEAINESYLGVIPSLDVMPIADDPGGNQICIGIRNEYIGKIFFWDHQDYDENDEASTLIEIAPSFETFLEQCV